MGVLKGALWLLCLATVSAELLDTRPVSRADLAAEPFKTYKVHNMSLDDLPPAYQEHLNNRKRDWKNSNEAFSIQDIRSHFAATGMAGYGPEVSILNGRRKWYRAPYDGSEKPEHMKDYGRQEFNSSQAKQALQDITLALVTKVFIEMGGTERNDVTPCPDATFSGPYRRMSQYGLVFHAGAPRVPDYGSSKPIKWDSNDNQLGARYSKAGYSDFKKNDGLAKKQVGDNCKISTETVEYTKLPNGYHLFPSGSTMKVSCKTYSKLYGCGDQLKVAKMYVTEVIRRGMTEATFTVYRRDTLAADMRCSLGARPWFFNEAECPFDIPGDGDGGTCRKCPQFH